MSVNTASHMNATAGSAAFTVRTPVKISLSPKHFREKIENCQAHLNKLF